MGEAQDLFPQYHKAFAFFGVRDKSIRTLALGRHQFNFFVTYKRENGRKPDRQNDIIESCS